MRKYKKRKTGCKAKPRKSTGALKPKIRIIKKKVCHCADTCGRCTKQGKKCDKKIGRENKPQRRLRAQGNFIEDAIDFSYGKCFGCKYEVGCDQECNPENNFKYFQPKENNK